MRYRKLDDNGDMVAGHGSADFWYNAPEAVGQAVLTRLMLFRGEWFLDITEGTPWGGFPLNSLVVQQGQILGAHTQLTRDVAIKMRTLATQGLSNIANYDSQFEPNGRNFSVQMTINTIYGIGSVLAPLSPGLQPSWVHSVWDSGDSWWDNNATWWDGRDVYR
jgi:hypothetical protein